MNFLVVKGTPLKNFEAPKMTFKNVISKFRKSMPQRLVEIYIHAKFQEFIFIGLACSSGTIFLSQTNKPETPKKQLKINYEKTIQPILMNVTYLESTL